MFDDFLIDNGDDSIRIIPKGLVNPGDPHVTDWYEVRMTGRAYTVEVAMLGNLFQHEVDRFRQELQRAYDRLSGTAVLQSTEGYLTLTVTVESGGALDVRVELGSPRRPDFSLRYAIGGLDQSHIPGWLDRLVDSDITPG